MSKSTSPKQPVRDELEAFRRRTQEYEQTLQLALDVAELGLWDWDINAGTVVFDGHGAASHVYAPPESESTLHRWESLVHPDDWPGVQEKLEAYVAGAKDTYQAEYRLLHKDGTWVRLHAGGRATARDGEGRPLHVRGVHRALPSDRTGDEPLGESEQRYRELFESIGSGVVVYRAVDQGRDFVIVDFNPAAGRIEQFTKESVIGRRVAEAFSGIADSGLLEVLQQVLRTGEPVHRPTTPYHDSLTAIWRESSVYRLSCGDVVAVSDDVTARKQAEEAARQERHFSESALEAMPGVFFMFDERGRLAKWNRSLETLSGYTGDEIAQRTVFDMLRPDCWELVKQRVQEVFSKGSAVAEVVLVSKDGRETPFYCHGRYTVLADQPYVLGMGIDISERKEAEESLRRNRNMTAHILNSIPQSVFWKDRDGVYLGCNDVFARAVGIDHPAQIVGKTDYDLPWPQGDADAYRADDRQVIEQSRAKRHIIEPLQQADGTHLWIDTTKVPLCDEDGRVYGVLGVYADITERIKTEEALRDSEHRFRALVTQAADAFYLHDEYGRILDVNQKACESLGYTRTELLAMNMASVDVEIESHRHKERFWNALRAGEPATFEGLHRRKDGSTFPVEVRLGVMELSGRRLMLGLVRDITERKRTEETLIRICKAVECASDAIGMSDAQGHHFYQNKAFTDLFEYQPEEITVTSGEPIGYVDKGVACEVFATIRGGGSWSGEVEMKSKSGRRFPVRLRADAIKDEQGNVIGLVGVHTDITERKRAEESLGASEQRYRNFVANATEGIYRIDFTEPIPIDLPPEEAAARITRCAVVGEVNEALARMYGLRAADMMGRPATDFAPEYGKRAALVLQRENYQVADEETLDRRADGQPVYLSENYTGVVEQGHLVRIWGVQRDITERKRAEEQERLRQTELRRQNELLLQLMMRGTLYGGELNVALAEITATGAELLQTERVSVWRYEDDYQVLRCIDAYQRGTAQHASGETLRSGDFPSYTASHRKGHVIAAVDVRADPRTCELPAAYWDEHDIHSLMDAPVWLHGQLGAVVCFEHLGTQRQWTSDDERVATTLATLVSLCVESAERRRSENALRENEMKYRALFEAAGDAAFLVRLDDDDLLIMESNQRALELFAATRAQFEGATIADLSSPIQADGTSSRATAAAYARRALAGETPHFEWRHRRLDGVEFDADVVLSCVPIGSERRLVGIVRDISRRKQAEADLIKRERLLDNIIEQNPYPLWISDAQGTLLRINRACCEMLGVDEMVLVNRYNVLRDKILHEQGILAQVQSVYSEGRTAHIVYNYDMNRWQPDRHGSARQLTIESTIAPVKDENGTITNAVFMHHDITQRVQAENELRESERKYYALSQEFRTILEAIPGSLVLISSDLKIVWANEYTRNTSVGLESSEMLGQYCYRCRHNLSEPCEACPVQRCFASGKPETGERDTPNGKIWELHAAPVVGDHGEIKGVIEVAYDVTDFRRADRELKASEARLRSLFRAAPIGIIFGKDRTTLSVNDTLCELLGYTPAELIGESSRLVYFTQEEFEEVGRRLYGPAMAGGRSSFEARLRRKDGTAVDVLLNGAPVRPEDPAAGFVVTIQDITQRRQAEEELKKLAAVVRHSSELVNLATFDGRMIFLNDAGGRMLGIDPETVAQHHVMDVIPEDWRLLMGQEVMSVLTAGQSWEGDLQYCNLLTGRLTDVHATTFTINDPTTGRPAYYANVSRDITERKRAEAELLREKEFTEKLLESLPGIFFLYDSTCHLKRWNKAHETAMGFTSDELRDWYIPDWHETPEDAAVGMALVKQVLETGVAGSFETTLINKEGHFIPYLISVTRLMTLDGPVMMGIGIDITERKQVEEERTRLAAILDNTSDVVVMNYPGGGLFYLNAAGRRVLGWDETAALDSHDLSELYPTWAYNLLRDEAMPVVNQKGFWQGETAILGAGGRAIPVSQLLMAHRAADGHVEYYSSIMHDITERKRAEEARAKLEAQLHQSQKMEAIGQLAGGVAHDFNNILTAVFGQLDLAIQTLESQGPSASDLLEGMHQIERSAHRAAALTRQLLAFSRRQIIRPEVLNLNTTLCDFEKMLRRLLTENVTLERNLAPDLAAIKADAGQLEQVIMNLVVNARDAMPNGGYLTLETRNVVLDSSYVALHPGAQSGEHVLLAVSDTGQGMDAATLEHIFEPFFTTKAKGQGTGLGLSTVYGIVNQAGGHVDVYSEPGKGTTFKVYLPAVHEPVAIAKSERAEAAQLRGVETVMICEDEEVVRELTARMITGAGYNVLVAASPARALKLAAEHNGPLDLLITDVIMPEMNGRQLADALLKLRPQVRTLFVSGYTANVIAHHGVLNEGVDFLEKPYSRHALLVRIREMLDRPRRERGQRRERGSTLDS